MDYLTNLTLVLSLLNIGISIGTLLTTLRYHGRDIRELKAGRREDVKVQQDHGERISYLEARQGKQR